jgi:hypothetical protein
LKAAFKQESDKPEVVFLDVCNILDYTSFYEPLVNPDMHYHQEPHCFRIKNFCNSNADESVVLVHYKN